MNQSLFSSNVSTFREANSTCHSVTCADRVSERKYKFGLGVLMALGVFLGLWFNSIIIILTIRYKFLRVPINYAVVNLSVADIFSIVIGLCPTTDANLQGYSFQSKSFCIFQGFCVALFGKCLPLSHLNHCMLLLMTVLLPSHGLYSMHSKVCLYRQYFQHLTSPTW